MYFHFIISYFFNEKSTRIIIVIKSFFVKKLNISSENKKSLSNMTVDQVDLKLNFVIKLITDFSK